MEFSKDNLSNQLNNVHSSENHAPFPVKIIKVSRVPNETIEMDELGGGNTVLKHSNATNVTMSSRTLDCTAKSQDSSTESIYLLGSSEENCAPVRFEHSTEEPEGQKFSKIAGNHIAKEDANSSVEVLDGSPHCSEGVTSDDHKSSSFASPVNSWRVTSTEHQQRMPAVCEPDRNGGKQQFKQLPSNSGNASIELGDQKSSNIWVFCWI